MLYPKDRDRERERERERERGMQKDMENKRMHTDMKERHTA